MLSEVSGEFQKCDVFFAYSIDDSNGCRRATGKANDRTSGSSELTLNRLRTFDRLVKVLFEKLVENIHKVQLVVILSRGQS